MKPTWAVWACPLLAVLFASGCQDTKSLSGTALWLRFGWSSELNIQRLEVETAPPLGETLHLPQSPDVTLKSGDTLRVLLPDSVGGTALVMEARGFTLNALVAQATQTVVPQRHTEVEVDLVLQAASSPPDAGASDAGIPDGGTDNPCERCDPRRADGCVNGTCHCGMGTACSEDQACVDGVCVCNAQSCSGCCRGTSCLPGTAMDACGAAGSTCQSCSQSLCTDGVCTNACNAQLCPQGCCSGTQCHPPDLAHCGGAGRTCVACDLTSADTCTQGECRCGTGPACAAGLRCDQGQCRCDAQSCGQGCCEGTRCRPRSLDTCAAPGAACQACDVVRADRCAPEGGCRCGQGAACGAGQRCNQGQCICDANTCPDGCCQNNECRPRSAGTCGTGGGACSACDPLRADRCGDSGQCLCGATAPCSEGQRCTEGICRCHSTSCPNGCCEGDLCLPASPLSCGTAGAACTACNARVADTCRNGTCQCGEGPRCSQGERCRMGLCQRP